MQTFINKPADMAWLLKAHGIKAKSAIIIGNEDCPDIVEAYKTRTPTIYDKHDNYVFNVETGKLVRSIPIG